MKNFGLMTIFSLLLSTPITAKTHMIAEIGIFKCLKQTKETKEMLSSLNISTSGATNEEKILLGNVANTIEELTNQAGAQRILGGLKVIYKDVLGNRTDGGCLPAHQLIPGQIHMGRQCSNGFKIPYTEGILIHEMGHFVANKNGLYSQYNKNVRRNCKLTTYMHKSRAGKKHKNRNEEFAEVFAAYLLYGKKLKRKCKQSYEFMRDHVFIGSESACR